jgi:3-dehydroquinate dehydratase type I
MPPILKLCASVSAKTVSSLRSNIQDARRVMPDYVELRLDYIRNLDTMKVESIRDQLQGNEILTIRSRHEGGQLLISEKLRIELIRFVISRLEPYLIDIEIRTLQKNPLLIQELESSNTKLVASFHNFQNTPSLPLLNNIIASAPLRSKSLFAIKIATKANSLRDNLKVLALYSNLRKISLSEKKLVAFCMGEFGIPSRILSLFLGSPFGYTSIGHATAPGQLDFETMAKIVGR